jgi:hypothetical protein
MGIIKKSEVESFKKQLEDENRERERIESEWAEEESRSLTESDKVSDEVSEVPGRTKETGKKRIEKESTEISELKEILIDTAVEELGFTKEDHGEDYWANAEMYVDYLLRRTGMENNLDVGDPVIYLSSLREASGILDAIENKPSTSIESMSGKNISETINLLKKQLPKYKGEDRDVINFRIETLDMYGEFIQEVIDNKLKPNEQPFKQSDIAVGKEGGSAVPRGAKETPSGTKGEGAKKQYPPEQQTQIDAINKEYDEKIADAQKELKSMTEEARQKVIDKATKEIDKRNTLFGDADASEGDLIKPEDQGFEVSRKPIEEAVRKFDERKVELTKQIEALNKERESKIGEAERQQTMDFGEEPEKKPPTINKEQRATLDGFIEKLHEKGGTYIGTEESTAGVIVKYKFKGDTSEREATIYKDGQMQSGVSGERVDETTTPLRQEAERILTDEELGTTAKRKTIFQDLIHKSGDIEQLKSLLDMPYVKKDMELPKEINGRIRYLEMHPEKQEAPSKKITTTDDGVKYKGKTYTEIEQVQDDFADKKLTFDEQRDLMEQVRRYENKKMGIEPGTDKPEELAWDEPLPISTNEDPNYKHSDLNNAMAIRNVSSNMIRNMGLGEGTDFRVGFITRFARKARGLFNPRSGIIRAKGKRDFRVVAHEIGHWLDFEIFDIRGIISTMAPNKQLGPGIDYNGKIYTDVKQVEADMKDRVLTISEGNELLLKVRKFEALKLKEKYSEVVEQTRAVGVKYKSKTYKSVRDINNAVKAGVMTQDMGNKKIAEFNTKNKGRDVRIQAMNDKYGTDVVAGIMQRNTFKQELDGLLADIRYPMKQRKRTEAIAEFVYNYIVDPKQVIDSTPNFLAWFEKMLDNAPPIKKALHQAREDWAKYDAQDIRTKLEAEQKAPEKERTPFLEGIVNIAGEMYYSMVNQLAPIKGVVDEWRKIVGEEVYQPFKDAHLSAKAMLGIDGRAMQWLLHNPYFNRGNNVVFRKDVKGLLKIVKPIIDTPNYESYKTYLLALDSIESHMREKPEQAYYGLEEARKAKALYEEEFGARKLMEFQDDVRKYNEALLDFYVESGRISKETADYWKTEHQFYVPLRRIAEVYETHRGRQKVTRDMLPESERAIFSRKGSQKQVKDIFESMLENTYHILHSGEQNLLNRNIIDMLKDIHDYNRKNRMGAILDEIDPRDVVAYRDPSTGEIRYSLAKERPSNFRKPQGRIVVVYENGKPRFYDVAPEYYDNIFKVVGPQTASMNKIIKVLSLPSRWLQAGAVVYDPTFPIRNIFRDQMSAFFYSKHSYHPGWFIKGITSTIGKDEYYHKWLASGADQSFLVSADKMMSEDYMSKKIGDMTQRKFKAYGKNPLLALQDFSILSEMGTRIGAFQNAYKKTGNVRLAMEESRDIAADYGIKGASMKNILPFYPFLNARTQHARMTIQSMKKAPVEFLLKGIAGVTIPSLLNWLRNNLDDDDRDLYQSLPTWRRVGMFNIRIPFTDHFMPIPKGFFGVMFGSSIESALDALVGDDPRVAKELASQIYEEISPVGNWSEVIPLIARPAIEDAVNQKGYTGKPIVSESMKMLEKPQQFYTSTPEIIKKIGEGLNWSPVRIEHYVRSYTGGAGIGAVNILDETLQLIGIVEKKPEDTFTALSRLPMLKAVLTEKPIGLYSGYVSEFYETLDKIEKVNFTFNNYIKNDDADAAEKFLENKENKKMYSFYLGNSTAVNAFRQSLTWVRDAGYAVMKDDLLTGKEKQEEISRMNNIVQETVLRFKKAYDNNEWFDYGKEMDDIIKQMKADKKEGTAKLTAEKNVYNPYWQQARLKDKETFDLLREFGGLREIEQTRSYSRYGEKIELMPEDARAFNEELISDFIKRVDYNLGKKREQWLEYQQETDSNDPLKTRLESLLDEQWSFALKATKETFTPSENK